MQVRDLEEEAESERRAKAAAAAAKKKLELQVRLKNIKVLLKWLDLIGLSRIPKLTQSMTHHVERVIQVVFWLGFVRKMFCRSLQKQDTSFEYN